MVTARPLPTDKETYEQLVRQVEETRATYFNTLMQHVSTAGENLDFSALAHLQVAVEEYNKANASLDAYLASFWQ